MSAEQDLPVTVGAITITSCSYEPQEGVDEPDPFPQFLVTGRVRQPDGENDFTRKVSIEFDGRDSDHEHVSGLDLDELPYDGSQSDRGQVFADLYDAIGQTKVYRGRAKAYYGEQSGAAELS